VVNSQNKKFFHHHRELIPQFSRKCKKCNIARIDDTNYTKTPQEKTGSFLIKFVCNFFHLFKMTSFYLHQSIFFETLLLTDNYKKKRKKHKNKNKKQKKTTNGCQSALCIIQVNNKRCREKFIMVKQQTQMQRSADWNSTLSEIWGRLMRKGTVRDLPLMYKEWNHQNETNFCYIRSSYRIRKMGVGCFTN